MVMMQWDEFRPYFTPEECGELMDYGFMLRVLALRKRLNLPMIVHAGYSTIGHAPDSYHGKGMALDFHVENASPRRVLLEIDRLGVFGGVGWYSWWNHPGFHIDARPLDRYQRWYSPRAGEYIYLISST
jgi:hypothetical protein